MQGYYIKQNAENKGLKKEPNLRILHYMWTQLLKTNKFLKNQKIFFFRKDYHIFYLL